MEERNTFINGNSLVVLLCLLFCVSAHESELISSGESDCKSCVSDEGSGRPPFSASQSDFDVNNQNPCSFRGTFLLHRQSTRLDPCTLCTCDNGTTRCNIESCPSHYGCERVIVIPQACCPQCPYEMYVSNIRNLHDDIFEFSEDDSKEIRFGMDVEVDRPLTSRYVRGVNLWKLSAWVSPNRDGSGPKYSYENNILNRNDSAKDYSKLNQYDRTWDWSNLRYIIKFEGGTCYDYKYFCVEFGQTDNPLSMYDLSFTFQAVDDEHWRLIDCVPLGKCTFHLTAISLSWELTEVGDSFYGQETPIHLDVHIEFEESGKQEGDGMWRVGLFGSTHPNGDGPRFSEVYQTLDEKKTATPMNTNKLDITRIRSDFELGAIGCSDVQYICVEFAKGATPNPHFGMGFDTDASDSSPNSLITCKQQQECSKLNQRRKRQQCRRACNSDL